MEPGSGRAGLGLRIRQSPASPPEAGGRAGVPAGGVSSGEVGRAEVRRPAAGVWRRHTCVSVPARPLPGGGRPGSEA